MADAIADPLAAKIRTLLRGLGTSCLPATLGKGGDEERQPLPVVYSSEKATRQLLDLTEEQKVRPRARSRGRQPPRLTRRAAQLRGASEFGAVDNFRLRVLPVLGTLPAVFGMAMASFVLTGLAEQPFAPMQVGSRHGRTAAAGRSPHTLTVAAGRGRCRCCRTRSRSSISSGSSSTS